MITVGLTGGFGTGKSFVAGIFKKLGARVIDADSLAHRVLKKGSPAYKRAVSVFGGGVLRKNGSINRKKLGGLVFNDRKKLAALNRIVHPAVIASIREAMKAPSARVLVIDAPLICEAGLAKEMDLLVVVKASRKKR